MFQFFFINILVYVNKKKSKSSSPFLNFQLKHTLKIILFKTKHELFCCWSHSCINETS